MPSGWGLPPPAKDLPEPEVDSVQVDTPNATGMASGRSWDMPVGTLAKSVPEVIEWSMLFMGSDIESELAFYCETGDVSHLWRAWRTARAFGDVPPAFMAMIAPHLDKLATEKSEARAEQREGRGYALFRYYHELNRMAEKRPGCAKDKTEARQFAVRRTDTDEGTLKQMILKHEGKGQRGKKR